MQKNDCSIRFPTLILYPPFSRELTSRDSSYMRALRVAKGLQRTRLAGSHGSSTRAARLWIDRSCSPFVMSRCNRRVTNTREETRWETTQKTYGDTCSSEFYNFKVLLFKSEVLSILAFTAVDGNVCSRLMEIVMINEIMTHNEINDMVNKISIFNQLL